MQHNSIISIENHGSASLIMCPRCGAEQLHHLGVIVYDRAEDASLVTKTEVEGNRVMMSVSDGEDNPSSRRDGLVIKFRCEQCGDGIQLTLAQHKGSTEIEWRYKPKLFG